MAVYARPGAEGSLLMSFAPRYENYIGGEWVAPNAGRYFENASPVTGQPFCEIPCPRRPTSRSVLDAAHAAAPGWARDDRRRAGGDPQQDRRPIEENLESIAVAESWDNGKPVRETPNADIPLAIDYFRYFAGAIRAQEGSLSQIDDETVAYHFHEPLGRPDHPVELPDPDGHLEAGPGIGSGKCRSSPPSRPRSRSSTCFR